MSRTLFPIPANTKKCGTCIHFLKKTKERGSICIVKTDAERTARKSEDYKGFVKRNSKDVACPSHAKK